MKNIKKKTICIILSVCLIATSSGIVAIADDETTTSPATTQATTKTPENKDTVSKNEANDTLEDQRKKLQESLEKNKEKLQKYEKSSKATQEYIDLLDEEIGLINQELDLLNREVGEAGKKVKTLNGEIKKLKGELDGVQKKYDESMKVFNELNAEYQKTYSAYCLRLRAMYISGSNSIIVALLTSKDLSQFLSRYEMVKAITKSDSQLLIEVQNQIDQINKTKETIQKEIDKLAADKKKLDDKQNQLADEQKTIETKQNEIASKKVTLAEKRAQSDSLLAEYTQKTQQYSEYKYEDEQMIAQVEKEIDDLISGLKEPSEVTTANADNVEKKDFTKNDNSSTLYYRSNGVYSMTYPAPGHYSVSCGYGYYSNGKPHPAIDFPYPVGSKVVAAQKGIVITVKRLNYSYGYYVMIYHGTDAKGRKVVTLYAHNSSILVSVGQTVKKGQQIARGGSTGNSTGPHCHFEIRVGGSQINPATYLSR